VASSPQSHLLSVKDVATACQLSEKAVRRAIDAGELPAVKLRSRLRVVPQDLEAWIASCRQKGRRRETQFRPRLGRRPAAGTFRGLVDSNRGADL
jgi:excisionase family DNA binding protein